MLLEVSVLERSDSCKEGRVMDLSIVASAFVEAFRRRTFGMNAAKRLV